MVSSGIQADTGAMGLTAQQFSAVAQELQAVGQNLYSRLAALGAFWGGDKAGQQFAASYLGAVDRLFSFLGVAGSEGVPSVADAIGGWTGSYQSASDQELGGAQSYSDTVSSFDPTL